MPPDPHKFLRDMLDRAAFVMEFMADKSLDDLEHDRTIRTAVERELMVLGEVLYQLHKISSDTAEQIDSWKEIIRFRHFLVHGYDALDMQILWDVIQKDLKPLVRQIETLLGDEG